MDTKAVVTDLFDLIDADQNGDLTIVELLNGYLNMFETMGVSIKQEFKDSIKNIAEIIRISNKADIQLPSSKYKIIQVICLLFDARRFLFV